MSLSTSASDLASVIQLAVAPAFLLAGIAGFLNVMAVRLGRVIDRMRILEQRINNSTDGNRVGDAKHELKVLKDRVGVNNKAIGLCTGAGLSVCLLIASLFVGVFFTFPIGQLVAGFFILSMVLLIAALIFFLREIFLAIQTMMVAKE